MDGLPGLATVFKEEFTAAKVQRCQVHVARNVLCKTPKAAKKPTGPFVRPCLITSLLAHLSKKLQKSTTRNYYKFFCMPLMMSGDFGHNNELSKETGTQCTEIVDLGFVRLAYFAVNC